MNYLILDTEKTYNYGYILVNHNQEVLLRRNLIIQNNFENRNIIGETSYKKKKKYYETDPDARFISSAEGANIIANDLSTNNIDFIIAHNANEDKRQLELLHQQTGVSFPQIPFYDSINLVKILFPNNIQTGLEAIINDIADSSIQQTHTALQDCDLILSFLMPVLPYLGYFIEYKEIFAHDNDYEITCKFFQKFDQILPLPKTDKDLHRILDIDNRGEKTKLTNFLNKTSKNYGFWNYDNHILTAGANIAEAKSVGYLLNPDCLDELRDRIIQSCDQHEEKEDNEITITVKAVEDDKYQRDMENLRIYYEEYIHNLCSKHHKEMEEMRRYYEKSIAEAKERPRRRGPSETIIKQNLIDTMKNNFYILKRGGIFNKKARKFKKAWKKKNIEVVFELLNN